MRVIFAFATRQLADLGARVLANRAELRDAIEAVFAGMTSVEIEQRLEETGIAHARMRTMAEFADHPQLAARDRWREVVDSPAGPLRALLPPVTVAGREPRMDPIPTWASTPRRSSPNSARKPRTEPHRHAGLAPRAHPVRGSTETRAATRAHHANGTPQEKPHASFGPHHRPPFVGSHIPANLGDLGCGCSQVSANLRAPVVGTPDPVGTPPKFESPEWTLRRHCGPRFSVCCPGNRAECRAVEA
ncbi:CoA transferase [Saccharopolyspora thermophila]|uniref:CoA transferase n=1 Tax=Saccharopolyspora thermophila TaxID=89367 RepID=UPI0027E57541|nr:CoA transferase [Saccharopolyspora subtropica]